MLLACARTSPDAELVRTLAGRRLDWEWIFGTAELYSLAPLVYTTIKETAIESTLAPSIAISFRSTYRQSHAAGIYRMLKLQEVLAAFSTENISTILLKGSALAATVYRSVGLRPMLDIDLLVESDQLEQAARTLRNLRYVSDESYASADWYKSNHHHLAPFVSADRSISIELHQALLSPRTGVDLPLEMFWRHAQPTRIGSESALVPRPEHLLISICVHTALSQCFDRALRDIVDVSEILRRFENSFDWDTILQDGVGVGIARALYCSLWFAQSITGATIPSHVLQVLRSEAQLTSVGDASLRLLIPRSVFPVFSVIPHDAIRDITQAILVSRSHKDPMIALVRRFLGHFRHYSSQRHAKQSAN